MVFAHTRQVLLREHLRRTLTAIAERRPEGPPEPVEGLVEGSMPSSAATARAVRQLSPVIITGSMPAACN